MGTRLEVDASDEISVTSTLSSYESIVTDVETLRHPLTGARGYMEVQNEQDFLRAHHEMLAREAAKLRQQQQHQASVPGKSTNGGSSPDITDVAKKIFGSVGVVGPMASSGLSLPTVEKVLDRESSVTATDRSARQNTAERRVRPTRLSLQLLLMQWFRDQESVRPSSSLSNGQVLSPPLASHSTSPPLPHSPTPPSGGTQNEVLANFFQSLLADRKDRAGKGSASPAGPGGNTNRYSADLGRSTGRRA